MLHKKTARANHGRMSPRNTGLVVIKQDAAAATTSGLGHIFAQAQAAQALLPSMVQDWIRLMGEADALALVRHAGGTRITIPTVANDYHALAHILSNSAFSKLVNGGYAGRTVAVPKCKDALLAVRNARVVADYDAGLSVNMLAIRYGLTYRAVMDILAQATHPVAEVAAKNPNLDLFD